MNTKKTKVYYSNLKAILGSMGLNKYQKQTLLDKVIPVIKENVQDIMCAYAHQEFMDVADIVLHEDRHFGAQRLDDLERRIYETLAELEHESAVEVAENLHYGNREENGEVDFPVLKERIDARLRQIYGDKLIPFDERYRRAAQREVVRDWSEVEKMAEDWV